MADGSQAAEAWDRAEILALFDPTTGVLDRRVLSDEAIYRLTTASRWRRFPPARTRVTPSSRLRPAT